MTDSTRYTVPVSGLASFLLARIFSREEVAQRLDAANIGGTRRGEEIREEVLSAVDLLAERGSAWHAAQGGRESVAPPGTAPGLGSGEEAASSAGMDDEPTMTVPEAAKALGRSQERVRQLIHKGALPARFTGRTWLISASAVESRARERKAA